jgi:hypothetical protein
MCRKTENRIFLAAPVWFHDPVFAIVLKEESPVESEIEKNRIDKFYRSTSFIFPTQPPPRYLPQPIAVQPPPIVTIQAPRRF